MKKLIILSVFALFCVVVSAKIQTDNSAIDSSIAKFVSNIQENDRLCIQNPRTDETICSQDLLNALFNAYVHSTKKAGIEKNEKPANTQPETNSNRKIPNLKIELPSPDRPITPGSTPPQIDRNATQSNPSFLTQLID